jgi:hypothetical protein
MTERGAAPLVGVRRRVGREVLETARNSYLSQLVTAQSV